MAHEQKYPIRWNRVQEAMQKLGWTTLELLSAKADFSTTQLRRWREGDGARPGVSSGWLAWRSRTGENWRSD